MDCGLSSLFIALVRQLGGHLDPRLGEGVNDLHLRVGVVDDDVGDLQVAVDEVVDLKVLVVVAERVEQGLRHLDPAAVADELQDGEDGDIEVRGVLVERGVCGDLCLEPFDNWQFLVQFSRCLCLFNINFWIFPTNIM